MGARRAAVHSEVVEVPPGEKGLVSEDALAILSGIYDGRRIYARSRMTKKYHPRTTAGRVRLFKQVVLPVYAQVKDAR